MQMFEHVIFTTEFHKVLPLSGQAVDVCPLLCGRWSWWRSLYLLSAACALLMIYSVHLVRAQEGPSSAPPPMKYISPAERVQLSAAHDTKARVRINIELAETHLARAEASTSGGQFDAAANELGAYQALIENALAYLHSTGRADKLRDHYKHLELTLRKHVPRIEMIRRATPTEYAVNVKAVNDFVQRARTKALDSFYGDTVLREDVTTPQSDHANERSQRNGRAPAHSTP
jgi:hypothetical protein